MILHQEQTIITLEKDLFSSKDNNGALQQHPFSTRMLSRNTTGEKEDENSLSITKQNSSEIPIVGKLSFCAFIISGIVDIPTAFPPKLIISSTSDGVS
mgnify:CR=1 FL=1